MIAGALRPLNENDLQALPQLRPPQFPQLVRRLDPVQIDMDDVDPGIGLVPEKKVVRGGGHRVLDARTATDRPGEDRLPRTERAVKSDEDRRRHSTSDLLTPLLKSLFVQPQAQAPPVMTSRI